VWASTFAPERLSQHVLVEREVGDQTLQPRILVLQRSACWSASCPTQVRPGAVAVLSTTPMLIRWHKTRPNIEAVPIRLVVPLEGRA
jgi:hypothetical protein